MRPALEVADIFRRHGEAFRAAQGSRLSPDQRRVMAAIEVCRTTLGGHVEQCDDCGLVRIAYNSCRDRHCPIAAIALQNKAVVYDIIFKAAAETIRLIAADPKYLGAETGMIGILHTWGQALTHHPAPALNAHRSCSTRRGFGQPSFK